MLADLMNKLKEQFENKDNTYEYRPRPSLTDPDRCMRQMVYHGLKQPRTPLPGRSLYVFDDSNWGEIICLDALKQTTYKVHSEQMRINCPPPMKTGSIDGVVTDLAGIDYLLEIKNISHFSFMDLWNGRAPVGYFTQMAIYIWGLQEVQPGITKGVLFIKNKNQAQFLEYVIEYDKKNDILRVDKMTLSTGAEKDLPVKEYKNIIKNACDKFNETQKYIDQKKLPKRQYEQSHWRCEYCPYNEICWANYASEFDKLSDDAEFNQDVEVLCGHYLELGLHLKEMKKEQDEHKAKIKNILAEKNAKKGRVGDYLVYKSLRKSERIDKSLLPPAIVAQATKVFEYESLTIRKAKAKKGGKK